MLGYLDGCLDNSDKMWDDGIWKKSDKMWSDRVWKKMMKWWGSDRIWQEIMCIERMQIICKSYFVIGYNTNL